MPPYMMTPDLCCGPERSEKGERAFPFGLVDHLSQPAMFGWENDYKTYELLWLLRSQTPLLVCLTENDPSALIICIYT